MRFASLRAVTALLIGSLVFALGGCSEMVTYSRKANEEGMRLYRDKAYGDAAGAFRQAVRQEPRDYHSHFYLGVCYGELGEYQQAFSEYHTTLQVMGQTPEGRYDDEFRQQVLDTLALAIARHDAQEVQLNAAEQQAKQSQNSQDWLLLGKIYRLKGDADLAMDAYRRACHFGPDNFYARKEAGLFLLEPLKNTKDAGYFLLQAYRLNPNDEVVNNALARLGITPEPSDKAVSSPSPVSPAAGRGTSGRTAQLPRD